MTNWWIDYENRLIAERDEARARADLAEATIARVRTALATAAADGTISSTTIRAVIDAAARAVETAAGDTKTVAPGNHPITARDDRLATAEVPGRASPFPDGREGPGVTQNADAGPATRAHIEADVVAALGLHEELAAEFNEPSMNKPQRIRYKDRSGIDWFRDNNPNIGPVRAVRRYVTDWQEVDE